MGTSEITQKALPGFLESVRVADRALEVQQARGRRVIATAAAAALAVLLVAGLAAQVGATQSRVANPIANSESITRIPI